MVAREGRTGEETDEPVRYRGTSSHAMRGVPHLVVALAAVWSVVLYGFGLSVISITGATLASLTVGIFWWLILWPVQQVEILGSTYRVTDRYGTSQIDLAEVTEIALRWIPYSGTWVVISTDDNRLEILRSRSNRPELLAIGAVLRGRRAASACSQRVKRTLGMT